MRRADAGELERLGDAAVGLRGGVGGQLRRGRAKPLRADGLAQRFVAGDQQAQEVGHGGAGDEHAGGIAREAERFGEPARHLALDIEADVVAAAAVGVEAGGQHLRQHADGRARAVHPAHEEGVRVARGVRLDVAREVREHVREVAALARQRALEARAHRLGRRLPDRPILDRGEVVDHVVERAVAELAEALPVVGVQGAVRRGAGSGRVGLRMLASCRAHPIALGHAHSPLSTSPNFANRACRSALIGANASSNAAPCATCSATALTWGALAHTRRTARGPSCTGWPT